MKYSKEELSEARSTLLKLLKPGDTVYTMLNHVSRSGMSRSITPIVIVDNEPRYMSWSVAILFGQVRDKYDGVTLNGCGMDMGFHLVYSLSRILFRDGFGDEMEKIDGRRGFEGRGKIVKRRPTSREDAAHLYKLGYRAHGRNGDDSGWDTDGGYALDHRWL